MEIVIPQGEYLNASVCKTGDTVVFLDEGVSSEIKDKNSNKMNQCYNFKVECNKNQFTYTPNKKATASFLEAWGSDSKKWIGQTFKVKIVTIEFRGKEMDVVRPDIQTPLTTTEEKVN